MGTETFNAAVAAEVLAAASDRHELLHSIVETARRIFAARSASIALLDETARDFVFEAVAGNEQEGLVGSRFGMGQGIAGAVAQSREAEVLDDVTRDPRFARDVAEETGYVPDAMMVAPLVRGDRTLGVLSVLDCGPLRSAVDDLALLEAFAAQAALAVELGAAARRAQALLAPDPDRPDELDAVARVAHRLLDPGRGDAGRRLLCALDEVLAPAGSDTASSVR